tara:strand:+ start:34 stop:894 length:861 start_codon:yes stop_codon:yes gene_type:complete
MYGDPTPFSDKELKLIQKILPKDMHRLTTYSAAVKCPGVKEADMSPDNKNICREHLYQTILTVRPKLVFVCGNLAMNMLIKKRNIFDKRGVLFPFEHEDFQCTVVPLYHPTMVVNEPSYRYLFELDIKNSIARVIEGRTKSNFDFEVIDTNAKFKSLKHLYHTLTPVACDIETTGFDFLSDKIQTIAFSHESGTYVIPWEHKDTPEELESGVITGVVDKILNNPANIKIFQNAKFDLKFLHTKGIQAVNVWDTKVMQHLVNENVPKSLNDLVNMYFPEELEEDTTC